MTAYVVKLEKRARRELDALGADLQRRIIAALEELAREPRPSGVKKLKGEKNAWRVRVGDYRIVYEIQDGVLVVLVIRIAHRREVYER